MAFEQINAHLNKVSSPQLDLNSTQLHLEPVFRVGICFLYFLACCIRGPTHKTKKKLMQIGSKKPRKTKITCLKANITRQWKKFCFWRHSLLSYTHNHIQHNDTHQQEGMQWNLHSLGLDHQAFPQWLASVSPQSYTLWTGVSFLPWAP